MNSYFFKSFLFFLIISFGLIFNSNAQITANFSADTTFGCAALANVQFTDQSTGNITSWLWDFGNGNTSNSRNPLANFPAIGQYTISLTVSDGTNSVTETKNAYINVYRNPVAAIAVSSATAGCPPLAVTFNSNSTPGDGTITQYIWDFGDGSPAGTSASETHSYLTGGTYNPSLQVIDQYGCSDNDIFNSINVTPAPQARFSTSNSRVGCTIPQTINFLDNSIGSNLTYLWDFGDGSTSTQPNPSHTYTALGDYTVSLTVTDPNCSDTRIQSDYVRINTVNVNFIIPDTLCQNNPLRPLNQSLGTNIYRWDFGDGNSSTAESPVHVYSDSGWYKVSLIGSSGSVCLGSFSDSVYVTKMEASAFSNDNFFCNIGDTVTLTFNGFNVDDFSWKILDDTNINRLISPYSFATTKEGIFYDKLIFSNNEGCVDSITIVPPRIVTTLKTNILVDTTNGCVPLVNTVRDSSNMVDSTVSWDWDFGPLGSSNRQFPDTLVYNNRGDYEITLKITSKENCVAFDTVEINAGKKYVPTFSVMGDSICPLDPSIFIDHFTPSTDTIDSLEYGSVKFNIYTNIFDTTNLYTATGIYSGYNRIRARIIDNGCETIFFEDSAFFVDGPSALLDFNVDCNSNRNLVSFNAIVLATDSFYWDLGDGSPIIYGNTSPVHLYDSTTIMDTAYFTVIDTSGKCPPLTYPIELDFRPFEPTQIDYIHSDICLGDSVKAYITKPPGMKLNTMWISGKDTLRNRDTVTYKYKTNGLKDLRVFIVDALNCAHFFRDTNVVSAVNANLSFTKLDSCLPMRIGFRNLSTADTTFSQYAWNFGGGLTSNKATDTITITSPGNYFASLFVQDAIGCSDTIRIDSIVETDFLTVDYSTSQTVLCEGGSTFFINLSRGRIDSILWDFGDGNTATGRTPTHFYNSAGKYDVSLTIVDSLGCKQTLTKTDHIDVQPIPLADFTSDTSISNCYPLAVTFEDLTIPVPTSWEWDFGDNAVSVFQDPFHNYTLPGNYDVTLRVETASGCKDTIVKPAYIQTAGPVADIRINKDTACINESITFEMINAQGVADFTWDFGDGNTSKSNPATYSYTTKIGTVFPSLIISNSAGNCVVPLKDTLFIENVKADFLVDSINCGLPASVDFINTSIGAATNQWLIDGNNINSVDANYTFNSAGFYNIRLSITSSLGCNDVAEKTIKVLDNPVAQVSADTGLCKGDSIKINAQGGIRYEWTPNKDILNAQQSQAIVFPDTNTTYYVKVFDQDGCFDIDSVRIIVPEYIGPDTIADTTLFLGEGWSFSVPKQDGLNYTWTPTNGLSCANCSNPIISPQETTTYLLVITDDFGCISDSISFTMEINDLFSVDVPTAFTPNDDRINDIIYAQGWGIKTLNYFRIYNRLGELVFETNSIDQGWDGKYKGKPQASDAYVYTVEVESFNGEILTKEGTISLLR